MQQPLTPRPRPVPLPIVLEQLPSTSKPLVAIVVVLLLVLTSPHGDFEGLLSPLTPGYQLRQILKPPPPSPSPYSKAILYDLKNPPSTIIFDDGYTPQALFMSATIPPVTEFRVMLPTTPALPVVVYNESGVTLSDIFNALYNTLNSPVSPSVWDDLNLPLIVTSRPVTCVRSYSHEECPSYRERTLKAERKIDLLEGMTIFEGITMGNSGAWELITRQSSSQAEDIQH